MRQLVYTMFITNNHTSFHLWWKENLIKYQKVLRKSTITPAASCIIFIIFRHFLMFYQRFFSPQVKRCAIITYKYGIYKFASRIAERFRVLGTLRANFLLWELLKRILFCVQNKSSLPEVAHVCFRHQLFA